MRYDPSDWRLYFIPEKRSDMTLDHLAVLAMEGGAQVIQLRLKGARDEQWFAMGRELKAACQRFGRALIINDRTDIAHVLGATGVHLGQTDMPADEARRFLGDDFIIGISVTNPDEALKAKEDGADYVSVGPVFATPVKENIMPLGLDMVASVKRAADMPLIAIGGINAENATDVIKAGADGIAVISAVSATKDPRETAAGLLRIINRSFANGDKSNERKC